MKLTVEERDEIMSSLNPSQKEYLNNIMERSRRTVFANVLAKHKGAVIPDGASSEDIEALLDEWVYIGYIDAGEVTPELKCHCGRPLRYQHIVEHKQTKEVLKLGINHLQEHMGIDATVVKGIMEGFDKIDLELDEILDKVRLGWDISHLPHGIELIVMPKDIQDHLDLELPLSNKQISKIRRLISETSFNHSSYTNLFNIKTVDVLEQNTSQQQWSFFEGNEKSDRGSSNRQVTFELKEDQKQLIREYLRSGIQSARIMCEKLIVESNANGDRYITEKPKIYVSVCFYIEELIRSGFCQMLFRDQTDCKYVLK